MENIPCVANARDMPSSNSPIADDMDHSLILPDHTVFNPDTSFSLELEPAQSGIDASIWAAATQHEELTRQYRRKIYQIMQTLRASVTGNLTSGLESQEAMMRDTFENEKLEIKMECERKISEMTTRLEKEREMHQQQVRVMEKMVSEMSTSRTVWQIVCAVLLIVYHYPWVYILHQ
ncbi:hypothetical protein BJ165DRAFT_1503208 [Panaeolus papilionaceus]|nr:hypothetical protein BJ165DRAFT_1503208 [Panaeolus papilionaceus]